MTLGPAAGSGLPLTRALSTSTGTATPRRDGSGAPAYGDPIGDVWNAVEFG